MEGDIELDASYRGRECFSCRWLVRFHGRPKTGGDGGAWSTAEALGAELGAHSHTHVECVLYTREQRLRAYTIHGRRCTDMESAWS